MCMCDIFADRLKYARPRVGMQGPQNKRPRFGVFCFCFYFKNRKLPARGKFSLLPKVLEALSYWNSRAPRVIERNLWGN